MKSELKSIGNGIRTLRRYYHGDLPAAAKAAGLSKSTWSKLENGKLNFTYSTLLKVSKALFREPGDLL